ncbi:MAG: hypothetical protein JO316_05855 [Abitibacteriaceae bacterium]|nr:hypothetical protein [Abditibacteriaceae bacterium]
MPHIQVDTIRGIAQINGKSYPMYCGFLPAGDLKNIADVPSFSRDKAHHQIATDISHPPVDQWQRPLDPGKTNAIKETYSRTDKDNLMANPVLIGVAALNIDASVFVSVSQKCAACSDGTAVPMQNYFTVSIHYTNSKKPLWILDGQHRLEGMRVSLQKDEPIPFVLLFDDRIYTGPFLAEIFTQVTTGATPMQPLHAEWMLYAFRLGEYVEPAVEQSMQATIALCKEVSLHGQNNPFHNRIQFNPYLTLSGYFAFAFNMKEWVDIIAENYYGRGGNFTPQELAAEIVKAIRAMEDLDQYKNNGSKLFSNENPHRILAEGLLSGLLKFLASGIKPMSLQEWKTFYQDSQRQFHRCRWDLPFVRTSGALSSGNGNPSKVIAKECFNLAFSDPASLQGALFTDYLQGVKAALKLTAYSKTATGRLSTSNKLERYINPGTGLNPVDLNEGRIARHFLRIEPETPNCHIISVTDPSVNPPKKLNDALKRSGLDISNFNSGQEIIVSSMSYSGDTAVETRIRLDK